MAGTYNIEIEQYVDFERVLNFKTGGVAWNMTGCDLAGQLRLDTDSDVLYPLVFTWINRMTGSVRMSLSTAVTTEIVQKGLSGVFDIILTDSQGKKMRAVEGTWSVSKGVTR